MKTRLGAYFSGKGSTLVWLSSCYLLIWCVLAILAPWISPDNTRFANYQVLEFAKLPPGSYAWVLEVPLKGGSQRQSGNFFGKQQQVNPIALADSSLYLSGESLVYHPSRGGEDQIKLDQLNCADLRSVRSSVLRQLHFPLGSDQYGRDQWSRLLHGARVSLAVGLVAMLLSITLGTWVGAIAGFLGGWVDRMLMGLVTVIWSLPTLLLALAISFVLGKGFWQLMIAIGFSIWIDTARLVRGQMLSLKEQTFAEAAQVLGYGSSRILFRHLLPNVWAPILVMAVSNFSAAILIESGLSFLGLGVEVPIPTWGSMINEGYTFIVFEKGVWLAFVPGFALIFLIVAVNLLGIGLRDLLDIKLE